jgi:actin-related protein 4
MKDEVSALVLDPGYSTTRAGFAGEDCPKSVVPSYYATGEGLKNEWSFGENIVHTPSSNVEIRNPWSADGRVEDWDIAARLWEYSIVNKLTGAKPTDPAKNGLNDTKGDMEVEMDGMDDVEKPMADSPLLMTEPGWNSAKDRERYIEIAMEDWGVPAFWLGRTGVLAA